MGFFLKFLTAIQESTGLVAGVDWSLCQRSRGFDDYEPAYQEGAPLSPFYTGFAQVRASTLLLSL